jgi:hypothetical protein
LYTYYIAKYYVELGGCDSIVFTAGIGENSILTRENIMTDTRGPCDVDLNERYKIILQFRALADIGPMLVMDLKTALNSAKTRMRNQIEDLEKAIQTNTKINNSSSGIEYDAEANELKAERDELSEEYHAIFDVAMSEAERLQRATKSAEQSLTRAQERLQRAENGIFGAKKKEPGFTPDDELNNIKSKIEDINNEVKRLKDIANPKMSPEEKAIRNRERQLDRSYNYYTERLLKGDFAPREKKEQVMTPEIFKAIQEFKQSEGEYEAKKGLKKKSNKRLSYWLAYIYGCNKTTPIF